MISVALPDDICSMRQEETLTDKGKPQAKKCLSNGNHKKKNMGFIIWTQLLNFQDYCCLYHVTSAPLVG